MMTNEETLEQLEYADGSQLVNNEPLYEGIAVSKKAIEKLKLKKPRVNNKACSAKCGCGATFNIYDCTKIDIVKYCPFCLQALDWSKT